MEASWRVYRKEASERKVETQMVIKPFYVNLQMAEARLAEWEVVLKVRRNVNHGCSIFYQFIS